MVSVYEHTHTHKGRLSKERHMMLTVSIQLKLLKAHTSQPLKEESREPSCEPRTYQRQDSFMLYVKEVFPTGIHFTYRPPG